MKRNLNHGDYFAFFANVAARDGLCVLCDVYPDERETCRVRSGRVLDAHHVIPQQTLKRELPLPVRMVALNDPRNGVLLGRWHHRMVEARMRELPIPYHVAEFAHDYGLDWWIERQAGETAA